MSFTKKSGRLDIGQMFGCTNHIWCLANLKFMGIFVIQYRKLTASVFTWQNEESRQAAVELSEPQGAFLHLLENSGELTKNYRNLPMLSFLFDNSGFCHNIQVNSSHCALPQSSSNYLQLCEFLISTFWILLIYIIVTAFRPEREREGFFTFSCSPRPYICLVLSQPNKRDMPLIRRG